MLSGFYCDYFLLSVDYLEEYCLTSKRTDFSSYPLVVSPWVCGVVDGRELCPATPVGCWLAASQSVC